MAMPHLIETRVCSIMPSPFAFHVGQSATITAPRSQALPATATLCLARLTVALCFARLAMNSGESRLEDHQGLL
jgi:hypothetical protein